MSKKVIFISGSCRVGSLNAKLVRIAANLAQNYQIQSEIIDLKNYEMPIYSGDYEAEHGLPENAKKLKEKFIAADGFFFASPEYNSSFSPLLKNTIDWLSRPSEKNEPALIAFKGKKCIISAASPGNLGGLRGLVPLRLLLSNIGVVVLPTQIAIGDAEKALAEDKIHSQSHENMLNTALAELSDLL